MKKGFTLIELLAVIVILAIILLIVMPIVLNIIGEARKSAFEASAMGFIKTAENQHMKNALSGDNNSKTYIFSNSVQVTEGNSLEFSGKNPRNGYVYANSMGQVAIVIENGIWLITKPLNSKDLVTVLYTDQNLEEIYNNIIGEEQIIWNCEDLLIDERDNEEYQTVELGNQCWMAENLRYTPNDCLTLTWNDTAPFNACLLHNPEPSWGVEVLYQWDVAMNGSTTPGDQGICPDGWHIPTDGEWSALVDEISGDSNYWCGGVSTQISKALSSTTGWMTHANACASGNNQINNNSTGFSGYPAGSRSSFGVLTMLDGGYWWSSNDSVLNAWRHSLYYANSQVERGVAGKSGGQSIRCILD